MATVDFTLDELLEATGRQTRGIVHEIVRETVPGIVRDVLHQEFKPLFEEAFDPYALAIQQDFQRVYERLDNLESAMRGMQREMKGVKRAVNQHSVEIVELKARLA